jgi:hypothetical protein
MLKEYNSAREAIAREEWEMNTAIRRVGLWNIRGRKP